jgi:hypothetical protein
MKRWASIISLLVAIGYTSSASAQPNWAEQLGFAPDDRVVILHGNDMGIAYEFNRPVQEALKNDLLTSASAISVGPWFAECADWVKNHSDEDVGVALSFVDPCRVVDWSPASAREEVPSLTTVDGGFSSTVVQFHLRADIEEVRREAEAQILRARTMGLQPTHLHPHLGALLTRPDMMRLYLDLAVEHWIPAVMVEFTPELVDRFRERGLALDHEVLEMVANYPLPKLDDIKDLPQTDSYEEKRESFFRMVNELEPGITQIFLNPVDDTPGARRMTERCQNGVWEAQLLSDPEVHAFLEEQEIVYTNWRDIMDRFEAVSDIRESEGE